MWELDTIVRGLQPLAGYAVGQIKNCANDQYLSMPLEPHRIAPKAFRGKAGRLPIPRGDRRFSDFRLKIYRLSIGMVIASLNAQPHM